MKFLKLFEDYNDKFITVYHGTKPKFVNKIKENGLQDKLGYQQGWYMVSTDFESALFHAHSDEDEAKVYVFEFKIPIIETHYWKGYPYLWKGEVMNDKSTWYALKQELPPQLISDVIAVDRNIWLEQKHKRF